MPKDRCEEKGKFTKTRGPDYRPGIAEGVATENRALHPLHVASRFSLKKSFGELNTIEFFAEQVGQVNRIVLPVPIPRISCLVSFVIESFVVIWGYPPAGFSVWYLDPSFI
jgi:hypothetical protein